MTGETDLPDFREAAMEEWGLVIDITADGEVKGPDGKPKKVWKATLMEAPL